MPRLRSAPPSEVSSGPSPVLVQRYLERALPVKGAPTRQVCIEQAGEVTSAHTLDEAFEEPGE
jgi:hypothetical protein